MKACGLICEYNPFHYGHLHHIQKSRALTGCDVVVCVMSGHFVQRGEPAIVDKWTRTRTALEHGVDLVIELPFAYATQSARFFAEGAVQSLALAQVSDIVFGSETGDLDALITLANQKDLIPLERIPGKSSIPKSYEKWYGSHSPNDILGINYLRFMKEYSITAHCIKRTNNYHDNCLTDGYSSATALRHALFSNQQITAYSPMQIQMDQMHSLDEYFTYIQGLLFSLPKEYLRTLFLMDEGIEQHLKATAKQSCTMQAFLRAATTKRYTTSRIRRTLIHLLHQTSKAEIDALPSLKHIRILGFNDVGQRYLKQLKQKEDLIIASKINQVPLPYRSMELKAADMYGLFHPQEALFKQELQNLVKL